ncbi:SHOCT domain-containing protein [Polynucleobacter paneuropaeus]|jgi:hypothetical protein|nr:SHOCT domain-containing protein [Polynucleobacter paneuropaeus]
MNKIRICCVLAICSLFAGCASITGSSNQPISVTTTHEGKPIAGAYCTLLNDKGTWYVSTPGSVVIHKSYDDLSATCKKEETHAGAATFKSESQGSVWGNVLAGGLIGYAVDASSGAGFSYPPTLNIEMIKGNVIPALPTSSQSSNSSSQANPGVIIETQTTSTTSAPTPARASIMPSSKSAQSNDLPNPAKKLEDLNAMLKKGLITADEYNAKKAEILNSM